MPRGIPVREGNHAAWDTWSIADWISLSMRSFDSREITGPMSVSAAMPGPTFRLRT